MRDLRGEVDQQRLSDAVGRRVTQSWARGLLPPR